MNSAGIGTVFISYAREDAAEAKRIYGDLSTQGIKCWLDSEDLMPGQRWKPAIQAAIRGSNYFLALLSGNSVEKRGYVQAELKEALRVLEEAPDDEIFLIPIRLDDCAISNQSLSELNWINLFEDYDSGIVRVVRAIQLGQKSQIAVTNLTVGGRKPTHTEWSESDLIGTVWHQEIEGGNPEKVYVEFTPEGGFRFKYLEHEDFMATDMPSKWLLRPSLLTLEWNNGYNLDAFPLFEAATDVLYGTQSVGNRLIVFSKLSS